MIVLWYKSDWSNLKINKIFSLRKILISTSDLPMNFVHLYRQRVCTRFANLTQCTTLPPTNSGTKFEIAVDIRKSLDRIIKPELYYIILFLLSVARSLWQLPPAAKQPILQQPFIFCSGVEGHHWAREVW